MSNVQHWSTGCVSIAAPDCQNTGIAILSSVNTAMSSAAIPTQYKVYPMCQPSMTIVDATMTSITTTFPGVVSGMVMGGQGSMTCSTKVLHGSGLVTRGLVDSSIQNGYPIANSVGVTTNTTNLKLWVMS